MKKKLSEIKFQGLVIAQFSNLDEQIHSLKTEVRDGFKEVEHRFSDMEGAFTSVSKAVDRDAVTIVGHEKRIGHIENKLGFSKNA